MSLNTEYAVFSNEKLPPPDIIDFSSIPSEAIMLYSSAHFYRTETNANIELDINLGPNLSPIIFMSPNVYLGANTFNAIKPVDEISFPDNKDALVLKDLTFLHDVLIQYKLVAGDGTNYINQRELRCTLVNEDGVVYDSSLFANQQPDPGQHDNIFLRGHIAHNLGDKVKIKFNIVQDNTNAGHSATKLRIFRIAWNILGLKTSE
jgi:hypothetical protein